MNASSGHDFWESLAARAHPAGALATIENPRTVGWLVTGVLGGAALLTAMTGLVLFRFGEEASGWATLGLSLCYLMSWGWHAATGNVAGPAWFAASASIANQVAVHILLGGYAYSGGYLMWSITLTFALVLMLGHRQATAVGVVVTTTAVILALAEGRLSATRPPPSTTLSTILFTAVFIGNVTMVTSVLVYFMKRLSFERGRAEKLLRNVLPAEVAAELKERGKTTAKRFEGISVLFADIVGFTVMSSDTDPEAMVRRLNTVFSHFDALAEKYGCEKIRTMGDAYMAASGLPVPRPDHAHALAAMALDMLEFSQTSGLVFRLGINSGPVVAGVIGTRKFQYDIWGDTVNTASRMESHGEPGRIQISETTYRLIGDAFECTPRGSIDAKGKGKLDTWFLESARDPAPPQ